MKNRARMRIERDHSRHSARRARAFHHSLHDQLMSEMQAVKHAEREHCRSLNLGVVGSVKEAHFYIADFRLPISDLVRNTGALNKSAIGSFQSAVFMIRARGRRKQNGRTAAASPNRVRV